MKVMYILLSTLVGAVLAIHLAMNSSVGTITNNPRMANAVFWIVGAIVATIIAVSGWNSSFFTELKNVPVWLLLAGALGAVLVFIIAWLIPNIGAGTTNVSLLAGQVIAGIVIAHFGLFGSPIEEINPVRIIGIIIMIVGATLAILGKIPFTK